jgi:hypothetical protein
MPINPPTTNQMATKPNLNHINRVRSANNGNLADPIRGGADIRGRESRRYTIN